MTPWWQGLVLGVLGAAVADGYKIGTTMLSSKRWPWTRTGQRAPFVVALAIRMACPGVLAAVVALQHMTGWSNQPLVLLGIGLAGPTSVQQSVRFGRVVVKAIVGEFLKAGEGDRDA
jgi:hypothetical protein